jgi:predicted permease
MGDNWRAPFRRSAVLLSVAAALLLVVGAFNVAGLLVARTIDRRREFAVRTALGASRRHLVLPLVLEAAVLIGAGGALGVWTAPRLLESLLELAPVRLPQYVSVGTSMTPLIASIAVIGVAGLLAALVPALLATRMNAADALKQAGRGSWAGAGQRRWPNVLIAVETALTLMLLVGGALLLRSHATLTGTEPGHRVEGMVRLALTASAADVQETADLPAFYERLRADLLTHPGVRQVGLVAPTLPPWDGYQGAIRHPRLPDLPGAQGHAVSLHLADAALLPSLGIPIVAGRNIDPQDISGRRPVAVVSLGLATRLGGIDAALDEEIAIVGDATVPPVRARVVGVAADEAYDGLGQRGAGRFVRYSDGWDPKAGRQDVYLPLAQFAQRQFSIAVHTGQDEEVALEELRRRLGRSAPTSAVHWNTTMRGELALDYTSSRFYAVLVNAFSLSALLLTAVSLFAILSHAVARRTGEIGLRRALGGSGAQIARFVAGLGLAPLAVGLLAGLTGSMAVARSAASMLYGVAMLDFTAFAGGALVLLIVAVLAASLPSHRASRIDPLVALKTE